jgi:hypothetical protein
MKTMDNKKIGQMISIVIIAVIALLGLFFPLTVGVQPVDYGSRSSAITQFQRVYIAHDAGVGGALTADDAAIVDDLTVGGDSTLTGGLVYSTSIYPLGIASNGQSIICGTTSAFSGSVTIASTLAVPNWVLVTQITPPLTATAFTLYASDPVTTGVTITSLNAAGSAGTTTVTAHYCIVGTK